MLNLKILLRGGYLVSAETGTKLPRICCYQMLLALGFDLMISKGRG